MKKKLLALFLGILMAVSCFGVTALELDTAEAELLAVTDDDELLYSPADKYGNLVGSVSFDNGHGNTDGAAFATAISYTKPISATAAFVVDPAGEREGLVMKYTPTISDTRLGVAGSAINELKLGKYTFLFDVYLPTSAENYSYFRTDINSTNAGDVSASINSSKGKWVTYSYDYEVVSNDGSTYSFIYNGKQYDKNAWNGFNIWMGGTSVIYIDDMRLYHYPTNYATFIDHYGNRVMADVSEMTAYPNPTDVIDYSNDDDFYAWVAEDGTLHMPGEAVEAGSLKYQTFTGLFKSCVYFVLGEEEGELSELDAIPYPSEVDSSWSDAGFYAWTDENGVYYYPGEAASIAELAELTLTAVNIADYNATLDVRKANEKGILVAALDFDSEAYTDKAFADTVTASASEGRGVVADPFNSGRGNVYNASSAGGHWAAVNLNAAFANGKVRFEIDTYTDASTYVMKQHEFHGADTSPYPTSIQNEWYTHISEFEATDTVNFTCYRIWNGAGNVGGNLYIDNFKCYFMPDNAVVFDNADGTQAIYYGDKNGNIVITAPSGVNANWSDEGFGGWTATNGTVYTVGDTVAVANLAGQVLKNEVTQTYFTFNGETVGTPDVSTIPYPSELDSDWSDAGFYAWVLDGKYYRPGTAGSADLADKTLTAVTIADYNATLGTRKATANGILVASIDFDSEAYTDKAFADTVNASASEGRGVVADPFNSGRGNVYNASSAGAHWAAVNFNAAFADGKTRFEIDTYTDASSYVTKQHAFHPADTSPYPTSIQNEWYTHITEFEATDTVNFTGYLIWNGAGDVGGNLYIDNFKCYFMPDNAVVFDNADGSQAIYYGDKNGNIVITAPSGVNANWSDDGFQSWKSSNGTVYNVGDEVTVAALSNQMLTAVVETVDAPIMLNKASLRLTGINGMRFASFVSMDARDNAVEYGYIVSRKSFFEDVDYDYNTNFIMPAGFDTENTQGTLDTIDMPFLCGVAYKPSINKDLIYTTDGSVFGDDVNYGDGIYYTCVLTGMEGYNQYHETMVVRPFIKIGENYFYGTTMEKSLYDVALAYQQANGVGANAFVDGIVSATAE